MLARLLLALLALVLATPAAAATCHAAPAREHHAGMAHHDPVPADPDEATLASSCIGCVPPSDWLASRIAEPASMPAPPLASRIAVLTVGRGTPPALPPPRIA